MIQGLLKGDVVFTNLEAAVALPGQATSEGRGFLTPPATLDALKTLGFNLLSLSNNHAFDLKATGIQNTIREADSRGIVHDRCCHPYCHNSGSISAESAREGQSLIPSIPLALGAFHSHRNGLERSNASLRSS